MGAYDILEYLTNDEQDGSKNQVYCHRVSRVGGGSMEEGAAEGKGNVRIGRPSRKIASTITVSNTK